MGFPDPWLLGGARFQAGPSAPWPLNLGYSSVLIDTTPTDWDAGLLAQPVCARELVHTVAHTGGREEGPGGLAGSQREPSDQSGDSQGGKKL